MMKYYRTVFTIFLVVLVTSYDFPSHQNKEIFHKKVVQKMTPLQQLKSILKNHYETEDGEKYRVKLKEGLSDEEVDNLAKQLPGGRMPAEIRELLRFASGFEFLGLDGISFDAVDQFAFENIFPYSIQLAGDGFGNFWILDIDSKGDWGPVFFVCHDPAVVVKHSEDLAEFIKHVDEFGKKGSDSHLNIIHEKTVFEIWDGNIGFMDVGEARQSGDETLRNFATQLPGDFVVADIRGKKTGAGFPWGRYGPEIEKAVRHKTELLWGFEKKEIEK